jgi:hypothetical protein
MVRLPKCGQKWSKQKADAKRKYPKCVPIAKARAMSQKVKELSAVSLENRASMVIQEENQLTLQLLQKEKKLV